MSFDSMDDDTRRRLENDVAEAMESGREGPWRTLNPSASSDTDVASFEMSTRDASTFRTSGRELNDNLRRVTVRPRNVRFRPGDVEDVDAIMPPRMPRPRDDDIADTYEWQMELSKRQEAIHQDRRVMFATAVATAINMDPNEIFEKATTLLIRQSADHPLFQCAPGDRAHPPRYDAAVTVDALERLRGANPVGPTTVTPAGLQTTAPLISGLAPIDMVADDNSALQNIGLDLQRAEQVRRALRYDVAPEITGVAHLDMRIDAGARSANNNLRQSFRHLYSSDYMDFVWSDSAWETFARLAGQNMNMVETGYKTRRDYLQKAFDRNASAELSARAVLARCIYNPDAERNRRIVLPPPHERGFIGGAPVVGRIGPGLPSSLRSADVARRVFRKPFRPQILS